LVTKNMATKHVAMETCGDQKPNDENLWWLKT
jgi:hypothetical protein